MTSVCEPLKKVPKIASYRKGAPKIVEAWDRLKQRLISDLVMKHVKMEETGKQNLEVASEIYVA